MSASSITPKNRDTIYRRLLDSFKKEGNSHLLFKEFALGKDWDKGKVHFHYLYLNMLCNFSCDVNEYFNEKLKELTNIECETKISLDEVTLQNSIYSIVGERTDNVTLIECLLKDIAAGTNDNVSKTLYIYETDLIGYSGTLEERIAAYVTDQGYDKDGIDSDLWIEYEGNPV